MHLLIYSPIRTARLQYTWEVLLNYVLRIDFSLTDNLQLYRQSQTAKINYSKERVLAQEVFIPQGNLLLESDIRPQFIQILEHQNLPAFFRQDALDADLPFDLPAFAFYLMSRYEEYLPFEADAHGRFEAPQSLAFQHHFLQRPLVNEWAFRLCDLLLRYFPTLSITKPQYQFEPTYDLDMAWAYLHKGWIRNVGAYARDLFKGDFANLQLRWRVQNNRATDPFFTFDYLEALHQRYYLSPLFFLLLGDYSTYDKNTPPQNKHFQQLIRHLHQHYQLGIHPSYQSNLSFARLQQEIRRLETMTGEPVVRSRQHFLKLRFPETYQNLLKMNILADYTLGYASALGFRASIATPYPWYDLSQETTTPLLLHPFQVMDVTLKDYMKLHPQEAITVVQALLAKIQAVGGTFCTLWHNSSFSTMDHWSAWQPVYEEIIQIAVVN